jgi:molecular chaperone GrpE
MDEENLKNKNNKNSEEENFEDVTFVESTEDGEELSGKDAVKKLREKLKICQKEKEEYLTGWQRAKADYINLQRELGDIKNHSSLLTKEKIIREFLPAIDGFDMAFANKEAWEKVDKDWRLGMEYIYQGFMRALLELGVERIDDVNVPFDPKIHQPIETINTDEKSKDHTIEKVTQIGYKMGDRIIRPARVNVFKLQE